MNPGACVIGCGWKRGAWPDCRPSAGSASGGNPLRLGLIADHVTPAVEVASRHRLRSANRHRLIVPRCRLNTYGRPWAFPVAVPTVWNSLPDELRDPACDVDSFKQFFKTILLSSY